MITISIIIILKCISIVPILLKVIEKVIEKQIVTYVNKNKILPMYQSRLRTCFSCSTSLSSVTNDTMSSLDWNELNVLILRVFTGYRYIEASNFTCSFTLFYKQICSPTLGAKYLCAVQRFLVVTQLRQLICKTLYSNQDW